MDRLMHFVLTPLYPPRRFGGIEKIVQHIAEGLVYTGDKVVVFSLDPQRHGKIDRNIAAGVPVWRIGYPTTFDSFADVLSAQETICSLVATEYKNCETPAIVHAHDWFVGTAALDLRVRFGLPLLSIFHCDKRSEYVNRIGGHRQKIHELQKCLAHGSDQIFCYSKFMRRCIATSMDLPFDRIGLFRCGIDEKVPQRMKSSNDNASPTLLYLGRLAPEKDVGTLLRAFRLIVDQCPECKLRIVGSGSEQAALERMVVEMGLDNHVTFTPFTDNQESVNDELLNASALILPSVFEPFGLVVLEAISRQVPVIAAATGGLVEIMRDGVTGCYFAPKNFRELAEKILECLRNPECAHAMATAALNEASRRFRWESAVSMIRKACARLITNGQRKIVRSSHESVYSWSRRPHRKALMQSIH